MQKKEPHKQNKRQATQNSGLQKTQKNNPKSTRITSRKIICEMPAQMQWQKFIKRNQRKRQETRRSGRAPNRGMPVQAQFAVTALPPTQLDGALVPVTVASEDGYRVDTRGLDFLAWSPDMGRLWIHRVFVWLSILWAAFFPLRIIVLFIAESQKRQDGAYFTGMLIGVVLLLPIWLMILIPLVVVAILTKPKKN